MPVKGISMPWSAIDLFRRDAVTLPSALSPAATAEADPSAVAAPLPLGRVVATEKKPNTPHEFHFWTAIDAPIGIGTIVRVEGTTPVEAVIPRVYGVVVEGFSYSDLQSPLHDVLGYDGRPHQGPLAHTDRTEIRLYTASVLRHLPEEPLQPVPLGAVYLADDADVAVAVVGHTDAAASAAAVATACC